jgi:hypothetical protein
VNLEDVIDVQLAPFDPERVESLRHALRCAREPFTITAQDARLLAKVLGRYIAAEAKLAAARKWLDEAGIDPEICELRELLGMFDDEAKP